MNLSITEQMQYSTVRIEVRLKNGQISTGTGYFYKLCEDKEQHVPIVVTNKHVIAGGQTGMFKMTTSNPDNSPNDRKHMDVLLDDIENRFIGHPDPNIDLAILPIAPILHEAEAKNERLFYIPIGADLLPTKQDLLEFTAVEDIIMVGYPNGIWDSVNNLPVFRKGITATHPSKDYNGKKEIMIDAACFPGSSGSPVFLCNLGSYQMKNGGTAIGSRIKFLGTLYAGPQHTASGEIQVVKVPTKDVPLAISGIPNNLGYVIKSEKLLDFEAFFPKPKA
ncbi:S1 family peptidase [Fusibacter sp. JL216-2]|uniref:S1 family peptidase n=1 Tax=Fusibacter sp. JL216-2 TaxID=3071453 RepID=UPI003D3587B7